MNHLEKHQPFSFANFCWDAWCCLSIVGIWPRFIEHRLLSSTKLSLNIPSLPKELSGLRIAQFSDLHLHAKVSDHFLKKIRDHIKTFKPDLILFTGDFLCFSQLKELSRLKSFLQSLEAPYGCYCVLGNHDYQEFVSVNEKGEYDVLTASTGSIGRVLKRLWTSTKLAHYTTEKALAVQNNQTLEELLKNTPFKLLKNESIRLPIKNSFINIIGLEEYCMGRCNPTVAFQHVNKNECGIILTHNPDSIPSLIDYPGDLILAGHTHGGQVNLPWLWKKFTLMENPELKRGLFHLKNKWVYVNRGVGSVMQFRWFAMPEILFLTLENS